MKLTFFGAIAAMSLVALAAIVANALWPSLVDVIVPVASATAVVLAAMTAFVIRRRRAAQSLSEDPESLEAHFAIEAQAGAMRDALIAGLAVTLLALYLPHVPAPIGPLVIVLFLVGDFWIRFGAKLRSTRSTT